MKAHLRRIRISPKKMNVVAGLVRRKPAEEALTMLKFIPKKAAKLLYKVVHSAVANAQQNHQKDRSKLHISSIVVNKGTPLKRFLPSTRGRALRLHKSTAHVSVELTDNQSLNHG